MNLQQHAAKVSQDIMYGVWKKGHNDANPNIRCTALCAKTSGIIFWDRIMFPRNLTK